MSDKRFDAVAFMRQVRDKMSAETKDMSLDEVTAYIEERAEKVRRELALPGARGARRRVRAAASPASHGLLTASRERADIAPKRRHRKVYDVRPNPKGGWDVRPPGGGSAGHHARKTEAVADARQRAQAAPLGQVRVHGRDGRIQTEWTYGKDPQRRPV